MYQLAIAGSTKRTKQVATTILKDDRFQLTLVITPQPRKVGRKQELINNHLHQFALDNDLPVVLVEKKIDDQVKQAVEQYELDLLLVVDFGYLIPQWLLDLPKIAPLNIHPSDLPKYRGSSPGQLVLLNGDEESAVTLMVMNDKLDEGPIITKLPFQVDSSWTQIEYYQHSFDLICEQLTDLIDQFATGALKATKQPQLSPTATADRISKQDAFVPWEELAQAMTAGTKAVEIERACRAYYPWPKLWTEVENNRGKQRMIIHRCEIKDNKLVLVEVQLEGKNKTSWNEVKNNLL